MPRCWPLLALLLASPARADPAETIDAAERAEQAGESRQAVALYQSLLRANPPDALARRAEARLTWLQARSEGDYRPLAALLRMQWLCTTETNSTVGRGLVPRRTAPARAAGDEPPPYVAEQRVVDFDAFTAQIDRWPPGIVRRESRAFVAGELARRGDAEAARHAYSAWLAEPGLSDAERRQAANGAAALEAGLGQPAAGLSRLREQGYANRPEAVQLRVLRLGQVLRPVAWTVLGLFAALGLFATGALLRSRRWWQPVSIGRLLLALYVLVFPPVLATLYDGTLRSLFERIALQLGGVLLVAAIVGAGLDAIGAGRRWRVGAVAGAVLACGAAAFLAVDQTEVLESFVRLLAPA